MIHTVQHTVSFPGKRFATGNQSNGDKEASVTDQM